MTVIEERTRTVIKMWNVATEMDLHDRILDALRKTMNDALDLAANTASLFTGGPNRCIHPDVPWNSMSEQAQAIAHTTAQQIASKIRELMVK